MDSFSRCPGCHGELITLSRGGCGGFGQLSGCKKCDKVWQWMGSAMSPRDRQRWRETHFPLTEYLKKRGDK